MSVEGRLVRGKANYEAKKFLENSETLEYIATLEVEKPEPVKKKQKQVKETKEEKMEDTEEESKEEEDDKSDE